MIFGFEWEQWVLGFSLSMPRFLAAMGILPFFSRQMLPGMLRTGVAISMCLMVAPVAIVQTEGMLPIPAATLFVIVAKEVIIGLMLGFPIATLFWGVESIGFYIDNQRGAAMASSADPLTGSDATPLGILFTQAFTVYFMASGAFIMLLGAFYATYQVWPIPSFMPKMGAAGPAFYLHIMDQMMRMVIVLSAPIIVTMFLSEFALALISRFAPQLNVFFLAMPIKSGIAVLMLIFYGPILFGDLMKYGGGFDQLWASVQAIIQ
jgi:type III secretion protein T